MNHSVAILMAGLIHCLAPSLAAPRIFAQEPPPSGALDFHSFSVIAERNIFNPDRLRSSENRPPPEEPRREPKPAQKEFFSLLGTLSYAKGHFAYFNGSNEDFRKILQVQDTIGDHKILEITSSHVRLQGETGELNLPVGMQMMRENKGSWEVGPPMEGIRETASSRSFETASTPQGIAASATAPPAEEDDDILKRLMQKREQELNNENK